MMAGCKAMILATWRLPWHIKLQKKGKKRKKKEEKRKLPRGTRKDRCSYVRVLVKTGLRIPRTDMTGPEAPDVRHDLHGTTESPSALFYTAPVDLNLGIHIGMSQQ